MCQHASAEFARRAKLSEDQSIHLPDYSSCSPVLESLFDKCHYVTTPGYTAVWYTMVMHRVAGHLVHAC